MLDRDTMLDHVGRIVAAVGVPVTVDIESGYGETPDDVGRTVAEAVRLGAAGGTIEDAGPDGLFGLDVAVDRLAAARAVAPSSGVKACIRPSAARVSAQPQCASTSRTVQPVHTVGRSKASAGARLRIGSSAACSVDDNLAPVLAVTVGAQPTGPAATGRDQDDPGSSGSTVPSSRPPAQRSGAAGSVRSIARASSPDSS